MQIGTTTEQTARKAHRCWWCGGLIMPGQRYVRWLHKECSELLPVKVHPECHTAWADLDHEDSEVCEGDHCRGCVCGRGFCECGKNDSGA